MNRENFIWEFSNSPYKSDYVDGDMTFGIENPIFLIDQYGGRRPALINDKFLREGTLEFGNFPSALLDSNVIDDFDSFVVNGKCTDGANDFLRFLVKEKWDYSPMFYYLEHFYKSSLVDFLPNAIRRTKSILTLHTMDDDHFLDTGKIKPNEEATKHYIEKAGVSTLEEVAEKQVKGFIASYKKDSIRELIEGTEMCLIKMVLIRKLEMPKESIQTQHAEFMRFLREDLDIMLAREAHFALHYFCDNAGKLLGIQANTPFEKAMSIVRSTAWDLFLSRMQEMMFGSDPTELAVCYVATHEKKLQELMSLFSIERIESITGKGLNPSIGFYVKNIPVEILDILTPPHVLTPRNKKCGIPVGLHDSLVQAMKFHLS